MLACDHIVERLIREGVRHAFGVGGANIEDMFAAVQRRRPELRAILGKHEHAAGTAADAYARLAGFGVVMTTSGGGAMNLVHALAEARASSVPLLAIVGEPPLSLQGKGAFQDTSGKGGTVDSLAIFAAVTGRAARAQYASELPVLLENAIDAARGEPPGPAVLLLAKDLQREEVSASVRAARQREAPLTWTSSEHAIQKVETFLEQGPVVILAGPEVPRAGARNDLAELAELLDATVATTPDARDAFDNADPRFLGVCGAMGHPPVARAVAEAALVVVVGTALPILARQGLEPLLGRKRLLALGRASPFVRSTELVHLRGEVRSLVQALVLRLRTARAGVTTSGASPMRFPRAPEAEPSNRGLDMASALGALERIVPEGSTVLVDAGNTGASAAHHLRCARGGNWLLAMGMAGMGYTFGAATGAACAGGGRCFVVAGDGAFYMQGLEIHTAVEHCLPITYVIFDNRAHGMCLVRERLLLGENSGYNSFRPARLGAGLAAMFPGLFGRDCETLAELDAALLEAVRRTGPSVISVRLEDVEVPPFTLFQERAPTTRAVAREATDGNDSNGNG